MELQSLDIIVIIEPNYFVLHRTSEENSRAMAHPSPQHHVGMLMGATVSAPCGERNSRLILFLPQKKMLVSDHGLWLLAICKVEHHAMQLKFELILGRIGHLG